MTSIDVTFRNLDEEVMRNFKAEAVRAGKTLGEALTEAMQLWLKHKKAINKNSFKHSD